MGELIIGDIAVQDLGPKFKNWHETGWDATLEYCVGGSKTCTTPYAPANGGSPRRYALRPPFRKYGFPRSSGWRPPPLADVQKWIKKFVIHHDGVDTAKTCWNVLQNERGLSCHFLIDNDGTIYQTIDLAYMAYHAAVFNTDSIGVEVCSRGDAKKSPGFYERHPEYGRIGKTRGIEPCKINNHTILAYKFDDRQIESLMMLADALRKHLPNLPLEFPRDPAAPSQPYWGTMGTTLPNGDSIAAKQFEGYIAHYHLTTQKWDPGPFNFKDFIEKLRGQRSFPVRSSEQQPCNEAPLVPTDRDPKVAATKLATDVQKYFDLNEKTADGGFFPVGPWGALRLWHGGIHLPATEGCSVHAPFAGRVVAARFGSAGPVGSTSFVLVRHDLNIANKPMRFWTLFMHLKEDPGKLKWLEEARASGKAKMLDAKVGVEGFDVPVNAGDIVGYVGVAGPSEIAKAQLHLEMFSKQPLFGELDPDWPVIDGTSGGRFCESAEINDRIDTDKDGRLSKTELADYYAGGLVNDDLRRLVTYHVTEWTDDPPWHEELAGAADLRKKTGKKGSDKDNDDEDYDLDQLVKEQLEPMLWWTDEVANALGLPVDGTVYHYHPMRLIEKLNLKLLETGAKQAVNAADAVSTETLNVSDDSEGENMFHAEETKELDDQHLELTDLLNGWAGDRPAPGKGTP